MRDMAHSICLIKLLCCRLHHLVLSAAPSCVVGCSIIQLYNCVTFSGRRSTDPVDNIFKILVSATVSLLVHVPCLIFKPDSFKNFAPFDLLNFLIWFPLPLLLKLIFAVLLLPNSFPQFLQQHNFCLLFKHGHLDLIS